MIRRVVASIVGVFYIFRRTFSRIRIFLADTHLHNRGNHPWKFELHWRSRFREVKEQTHKQTDKETHWHPFALEEELSNQIVECIYEKNTFQFMYICIIHYTSTKLPVQCIINIETCKIFLLIIGFRLWLIKVFSFHINTKYKRFRDFTTIHK